MRGGALSMAETCDLDEAIAEAFAGAIADTLAKLEIQPDLVASHGQTVFHRPPEGERLGRSLQFGWGGAIARRLGLPVVANFRAADVALGGHGAPLVPMVDWLLLRHETRDRCVQNLGGIANVTYLPAAAAATAVMGFDNGPGNVLLDLAAEVLFGKPFDPEGRLASRGVPNPALVEAWLQHEFFRRQPPKSTGRELFDRKYLDRCIVKCRERNLSNFDVLATLTELTARAIADSYRQFLPRFPQEVWLSGGGCHNRYLQERLAKALAPATVHTTAALGIDPDHKEAIAFAMLGYLRWHDRPGNLPSVTGAKRAVPLGEVFLP
ncbi:MAG: anhydro-N-acetylmuramic acid kinase [Oscillatoriales cyanobacterium SM2_1_8]|nr:anhydro-N-acetylmuramic acid kinase [Oscillatoriales cyanobacterium SM2_1_8]